MLQITIPSTEKWDELKQEFVNTKEQTLQLEHSLISLSKWESIWHKPFLSTNDKTFEETIDYIRCMTITQNVNPEIYSNITNANISMVNKYIDEPMTATIFSERGSGNIGSEAITSEIIYYWIITFNIPIECQKWHLKRLLTLIRVCDIKNKPPVKMSPQEIMSENSKLNDARRKALNSAG